jgi:hypothetical protein
MKKLKTIALALIFIFVTLSQQSCIGSFQLTKNLYEWNTTQMGSKWASEVVFLAFLIVPVYSVTLLADGIVLNAIEFWTGDNPLAMKQGEKDVKIVENNSVTYKLTAEQNIIKAEQITGVNAGAQGEFVWNEENQNWTFYSNGEAYNLVR